VSLQALTWNDKGAAIAPYDPARGTPLDTAEWPDGLVTYRFQDHPSYVLSHDPPNRYQLLGLTSTSYLLIATVEHATLDTARRPAAHPRCGRRDPRLRRRCLHVTCGSHRSRLVPITNSDGKLPHYLCFLPR
jgi:hypothetical protein